MVDSERERLSSDLIRKAIAQDVFAKWQLESVDLIEEYTKSLGWSILIKNDEKTGQIIINTSPIVDNPIINKHGLLSIIQSMFPIINKNTFLSDLKVEEIKGEHGILFSHTVATLSDLAENFDFYEIESASAMTKILITDENMCHISLTRGREGKTLDYMKTIQKIVEQLVVNDSKKNKRGL